MQHGQPQYGDYPTQDAYLLAWYTWRALRRDAELNPQERAAQWPVIEDHIRARR
ncbi:hypothetical protein [Streptomyces sp. WMMC897]|uniref:hypothetical protein n=1 Tax=Streptomyces sp. WMMC897 TaxID=3014782 RepID=UPI0022B750BC|nr:hypothetical protein [Streptomyces sp. WMMC897]MCZ7414300.1 hypothetical protein [Streptomyces sp. WMMC897]